MLIASQKQQNKCKINTKNQTYKIVNIKILEKIKNKRDFFFLKIITERGELGDSGSDIVLTNPPRETVSSIDVVVVTQRWWLQGEAWPWLSLGEQENRERHFKRGEGHTSMNFWRWWRHGTWWLLVATTKVWPWVSQIGLVEWKRAEDIEILKK